MVESKELARMRTQHARLLLNFDTQVRLKVEGAMRDYDAYTRQPFETAVKDLKQELQSTMYKLTESRKLAHLLEKRKLDLAGDKVRLTTAVATLSTAQVSATAFQASVARTERHVLLDRKRGEASFATVIEELEKNLKKAERCVVNAEAVAESAIIGETNARRDAEVAMAERDELLEDLLVVEREADEAKWGLLLAEKREKRAKIKLAKLEEKAKDVDVVATGDRSTEDWAALHREAAWKAHQREQGRFDAILAAHEFPPNDMAHVLQKRGLLEQIFDSPDGADIYFARLQERIHHISTVEYGMPLAMYMHYQLKIPISTILSIDQAASKKFRPSKNHYNAKILYSHPYRSNVVIKVPRIAPACGKMLAATEDINKALDISTGENGAVSYRPITSAFEALVKNGVGKHGMPALSAFVGGAREVPIIFQWDATGFKKQQLTTAALRNPWSPHSAELLELWAVGNVGDDKGGSTKLMGKENIDLINSWIDGDCCVSCPAEEGETVLLKPKPFFTLDLACLRHTEHISNSGFCGCSRDYALRTTPAKPTNIDELRELLVKCKSHTGVERYILSHMPTPGNDLPSPCTAPGCKFGHGDTEKVRAEWEALLAVEKVPAHVLTKADKAKFSKWRMAHADAHFNI